MMFTLKHKVSLNGDSAKPIEEALRNIVHEVKTEFFDAEEQLKKIQKSTRNIIIASTVLALIAGVAIGIAIEQNKNSK